MAVLRPRNRVVYFRVSEDEYRSYEDLCRSLGARSISDLIRSALDQALFNGPSPDRVLLAHKLDQLERVLGELNGRLEGLSRTPVGTGDGGGERQKRKTNAADR